MCYLINMIIDARDLVLIEVHTILSHHLVNESYT